MKLRDKAWFQGYACALGTLQRMDGSESLTTEVRQLRDAGGLTHQVADDAEVDPYDIEVLFPKVK